MWSISAGDHPVTTLRVSYRLDEFHHLVLFFISVSLRLDASGALSVAEQGTVLAQARTRPFDVLSHDNYVAPGLDRPQYILKKFFG